MGKFSFPGWAGPFVGAIVGVGIALARGLDGPGVAAPWLILWTGAGAAAGSIIWLVDASARNPSRRKDRPPRRLAVESPAVRGGLWFWIFLMLAVGPFVGYLGVEKFLEAWRMSRWPTAKALILESHVRASSHTRLNITTESFTPVVRYRYIVDGVEREGRAIDQSPLNVSYEERSKAEAAVASYPVGSIQPVYYDPAEPPRAVLEPGLSWGEAVQFAVVPMASLAMALIAFFSLRAEEEESRPA